MNVNFIYPRLIDLDIFLDKIPFASTVSNLINLFQKYVFKKVDPATINQNRYFKYINEKSISRCVVLLIPVFGNIIIALYDKRQREKDQEGVAFLDALKTDDSILANAKGEFLDNYEVMLAAVKINGMALQCASTRLRNDPQIVLAAVQNVGFSLYHANERFKDDKEIAVAAVKKSGFNVLEYVSTRLQLDPDIQTAASENSSQYYDLAGASETLKSNRLYVLEAIKKDFYTIKHSSEILKDYANEKWEKIKAILPRYKDDKEILLEAIKCKAEAFVWASNRLKNDKEFVLSAVREDGLILELVPIRLKKDPQVVHAALRNTINAIVFASEDLQNDEETINLVVNDKVFFKQLENNRKYVMAVAKVNGMMALERADDLLKDDFDVVMTAIKQDGKALQYASERLKQNKEIVEESVKNLVSPLSVMPVEFKKNKPFVLAIVRKNPNDISQADESLFNNKDFMLEACKIQLTTLRYLHDTLKDDRNFMLAASKIDIHSLHYLSDRLKNDLSFILAAMDIGIAIRFASEALQENKEVAMAAINKGYAFGLSDALANNQEFILEVAKVNPRYLYNARLRCISSISYFDAIYALDPRLALDMVTDTFRANNPKVALLAYQDGLSNFKFKDFSPALKDNEEVMLEVLKKEPKAIYQASSRLQTNKRIFLQALAGMDVIRGFMDGNEIANPPLDLFLAYGKTFEDDKEVAIALINKNARISLDSFSGRLSNDSEVVLAAINNIGGRQLKYAGETLKNDERVVLAALRSHCEAIEFAGEAIKDNKAFVLAHINRVPMLLCYLSKKLQADKEVVLACVKQNKEPFIRADRFKSEIMSGPTIVWKQLSYANLALRNDPEVVRAAMEVSCKSIKSAGENIKESGEFDLSQFRNVDGCKLLLKEGRQCCACTPES